MCLVYVVYMFFDICQNMILFIHVGSQTILNKILFLDADHHVCFYNLWNIFIVIRYRDLMLFQMLFLCLWDINHKSFIRIHTERAQKRQPTWNDYLAGICDCIKRSSRPAQIFMKRILLCKGYESHYGNY